jgi:hypothetical protein
MIVNAKIRFLYIVVSTVSLSACAHITQPLTWQQRRLEQPTKAELQWERSGHVMIYEGMKDREVEHALNNHFNRVQSMMFVNTVITDDKGNPLKDLDSGKVVTEDDGCD